jgi:hypothetical protein
LDVPLKIKVWKKKKVIVEHDNVFFLDGKNAAVFIIQQQQ